MINQKTKWFVAAGLISLGGTALAAVSAEEAKKLGGAELTEWGSERAGNKEGTIPAWTGERVKVPASYDPKDPGQVPDPFGDKPIFSINAQNMAQYADKLSVAQKELLKRYPNNRMDVYASHRTQQWPKWYIENSIKNATACKAVDDGIRLEGCFAGTPFPIPKTGNEVVWNHLTRYQSDAIGGKVQAWMVDASGNKVLQGDIFAWEDYPFFQKYRSSPAPSNSAYWKLRFDYLGPARKVGEKYIIVDSLDPISPGRRAWSYIPGQRRVKLAPDLAYDTPSPATGGSGTMDEASVFLGAQDRYNMKLIGKKEMYIMYNTNRSQDAKICGPDVALQKGHINPDCIRWELHRTWVVEANLKPGFRHILPKRMMYFDEDNQGAGMADDFDASGAIYRFDFVQHYIYYPGDFQYGITENSQTYDLRTGIYSLSTFMACPGCGWVPIKPKGDFFYSPEALAGEGIR